MLLALHISTTDRLGPASLWAAPVHYPTLGCSLVFFPFWFPSSLFFQFLPGARWSPGLGDGPLASGLAPHHHASRTAEHQIHPSEVTSPLPSPFSCSLRDRLPRRCWSWDLA